MDFAEIIQKLSVMAIPMILAITVHEAAHGWVADKLGDSTARSQGRVTFNPLPHIDLLGTVIVPIGMLLTTGLIFGWAKPVPVNIMNLGHPKRDMVWVALAGPASNLLMAFAWATLLVVSHQFIRDAHWMTLYLFEVSLVGVFFNLLLMALNLMPIPPLDGGRVMVGVLPMKLARIYARLEPFGLFIVILLLATGILWAVIQPIMIGAVHLLPGSELVLGILPL